MNNLTREDIINQAQTKSKSIALIYSPIELNAYIVEILSKDSDLFIHKYNHLAHFQSVKDAVAKATKYGANEFFLCLDNTYDECGSIASPQHYDYISMYSKH